MTELHAQCFQTAGPDPVLFTPVTNPGGSEPHASPETATLGMWTVALPSTISVVALTNDASSDARKSEVRGDPLGLRPVDIGHNDRGALARHQPRCGLTDATARARDDRDLARETSHRP